MKENARKILEDVRDLLPRNAFVSVFDIESGRPTGEIINAARGIEVFLPESVCSRDAAVTAYNAIRSRLTGVYKASFSEEQEHEMEFTLRFEKAVGEDD